MSAIPSNTSATGVFQAQFGIAPGVQDAKSDCEKWERLCAELLAERERLRNALERERLDMMCKDFVPTLTMEEVYAQVDRETTIEQLLAELEEEAEK